MSIDQKFVELTADVLETFFIKYLSFDEILDLTAAQSVFLLFLYVRNIDFVDY